MKITAVVMAHDFIFHIDSKKYVYDMRQIATAYFFTVDVRKNAYKTK